MKSNYLIWLLLIIAFITSVISIHIEGTFLTNLLTLIGFISLLIATFIFIKEKFLNLKYLVEKIKNRMR